MDLILVAVISLGAIGLIAAVILYALLICSYIYVAVSKNNDSLSLTT